jgi:ferritin-like protein
MLDNDPEPLDRCRLFRPNAEDHFEALVPRIYELGGKLPDEMVTFHNISTCPPAKLPADPTDMKAMMNVLLQAEQ